AVWLLEQMDADEPPPRRLYLTAPPRDAEAQSEAENPKVSAKQWAFVGRVTDPAGKPLAGVHVHWAVLWKPHENPETTVTDKQGRYRLEVEKLDKYMQLFAFGQGWAPNWRKSITPGPADAPTEIDFQLEPGRKLSGFVVDRSDQPIQGALVRPRTPRKGFHSSFSSPTGGETLPGSRQDVRTDEDGRFVLEDLPAGEVMLNLAADCRHVNDANYPVGQQAYIVMSGSGEPGVIHARVIDEATRKPVTDFIVTMRYR
ncbi:MAG: carboxypeptidase regulatory-like domain-containing protein, partial [bacterium]|nr:carboxypeptidase regulatory-like domain-containing protein [bacterium]